MQQRQIGKTGPKISAIGIGAMSFTNFYGETSENQSHDILKPPLIMELVILIQPMCMETGWLSRLLGIF